MLTRARVLKARTGLIVDLGRANVTFRSLGQTRRALEAKGGRALLIVVALAEKYLALLRVESGPLILIKGAVSFRSFACPRSAMEMQSCCVVEKFCWRWQS